MLKTLIAVSIEETESGYIPMGAYIEGPEFDEEGEPNEIHSLFEKTAFPTEEAAIEAMKSIAQAQEMSIDEELEIYR